MDKGSLLTDNAQTRRQKAAETTLWVVGSIVAVGWVASGLVAVGANLFVAIILGIVLLVAFPTVIGGFLGVGLTASAFDIPALGLVLRIIVAYVLGIVIGGGASLIVGRLSDIFIGSKKTHGS